MRFRRALPVLFAVLLIWGCAGAASIGDAEEQIAAFHKQLNAQEFGAIWQNSSADMHEAASQEQLSKLLAAVHRKLGKVVTSEQVGWRSNVTTEGSFAQVEMNTTFERGKGAESFTYRKVGEELKLTAYNINSPDMMLN